jgi:hypothetical protein
MIDLGDSVSADLLSPGKVNKLTNFRLFMGKFAKLNSGRSGSSAVSFAGVRPSFSGKF